MIISGLGSSSTASGYTPKSVVASLKVLSFLLRVTLQNGPDKKTQMSQGVFSLADLTALVSQTNLSSNTTNKAKSMAPIEGTRKVLGDSTAANQNPSVTANDTKEIDTFVKEINSRLPGPLTVLVNLLCTAQSPLIRQEAASLFQAILIDSRSCWQKEKTHDLNILVLECCLILSRDDHGEYCFATVLVLLYHLQFFFCFLPSLPSCCGNQLHSEMVVSSARAVLSNYMNSMEFSRDMNSFLISRIVSMIEELPALAQRQSEVELRNRLKLIAAYLSMNNESVFEPSRDQKGGHKNLQSSLSAEGVATNVQKALTGKSKRF